MALNHERNSSLTAAFQRIYSTAEIEVSSVIDLPSNHLQEVEAKNLHERVSRELQYAMRANEFPRGGKEIQHAARQELSRLVNRESSAVLDSALATFQAGMAARVDYLVEREEGRLPKDAIILERDQLPFIRFHEVALSRALRIRLEPHEVQTRALALAACMEGLKVAEKVGEEGDPAASSVSALLAEVKRVKGLLSPEVVSDVEHFFGAIASGTIYPGAIPIALGDSPSSDELLSVSVVYDNFGSALRMTTDLRPIGSAFQRSRAQRAWTRYTGLGLCFKVLSAWMRAASSESESRICAICYRHVAGPRRCFEHATKTHETREGRLGKRVRPFYLARAASLALTKDVRTSLRARLSLRSTDDSVFLKALNQLSVPTWLRQRAVVLADQLRQLFPLFSAGRLDEVVALFEALVRLACRHAQHRDVSVGSRAPEVGREHSSRLRDRAYEYLSLRGFFQFWFGRMNVAGAEVEVPSYAFDRMHPSIRGPLIPETLAAHLLRQRSWDEAYLQYVSESMPTAGVIEALRKQYSVKEVAEGLGISHQTLYDILGRSSERRRSRFVGGARL